MGSVVGPPIASALERSLGTSKVSVGGFAYDAGIEGDIDLGTSCGPSYAKVTNKALSECPKTKLVLSGYSQGAMCVHNALSNGIDGADVAAVVVLGDALNASDFKGVDMGKVLEVCGDADGICDHGPTNASGSHLSYGSNAEKAAEFVVTASGL